MISDNFVKVFDVLDSGFRNWSFSALGLIFVAVGIILVASPRLISAIGIPNLNFSPRLDALFRYGFLGFGILWTAVTFVATYSEHLRHKSLVQQNLCRMVEGPVENFVPMPYGGHAQESFSVAGLSFKYSDFIITDGFNNTSSHGGPISGDSYVRICYDPRGNAILRLEIRDFKGEVKDYARTPNIFWPPRDDFGGKHPVVDVPWYSNLFIVVYFLDLLGIYSLFVPYLQTFLRVKSETLQGCSIAKSLRPGKRTKLRNSMMYCDVGTRTVWLRPRGLNFVKVPLMVGKLGIDAGGRSIVRTEVCFSSGFPIVMVLFLWTVYRVFPQPASNASGFSPTLIVGFGLMLLLMTVINLGICRNRMQLLIDEAISELGET